MDEEEMDNDDALVGRVLKRREMLALFGSAGAALLMAACGGDDEPSSSNGGAEPQLGSTNIPSATSPTVAAAATPSATAATTMPSCVVVPALTEGPYFVDLKLNRSDIRGEVDGSGQRPGAPLMLTFNVSQVSVGGCTALPGATVDVWHCDAAGIYSSASDPRFNTRGQQFLRGYQTTDANGKVTFTTIYPGWYQGRAVHIHFKIRTANSEFTSQLFFDESFTDQVFVQQPYAAKGQRTLKNEGDSIYRSSGGQLTLLTTRSGDGYAATFDIGLRA